MLSLSGRGPNRWVSSQIFWRGTCFGFQETFKLFRFLNLLLSVPLPPVLLPCVPPPLGEQKHANKYRVNGTKKGRNKSEKPKCLQRKPFNFSFEIFRLTMWVLFVYSIVKPPRSPPSPFPSPLWAPPSKPVKVASSPGGAFSAINLAAPT